MKINIVVPRLTKHKFAGGILCIFEYAHGLTQRGHDVTILPMVPSVRPQWFHKSIGTVVGSSARQRVSALLKSWMSLLETSFTTGLRPPKAKIYDAFTELCFTAPALFDRPIQMGIGESYVSRVAQPADVNLATGFETARIVSMLPGNNFYFTQHFEPLFRDDYPNPVHAECTARQSYKLGLNLIANSSWLKQRLERECPGVVAELCPNAIDHSIFHGDPVKPRDPQRIVVISYGGRNARWKGFQEMVEAVAIVRSSLAGVSIDWRVYGDALIPPTNTIAQYTPLGFLSPEKLAEEYRKANVLLSASWYESFPLFPLEAMACGLAVVCTQAGTEEYAIHGATAEIVEPGSPRSIAEGLIRLIRNPEYSANIAGQGRCISKKFTWDRSVGRLHEILSRRQATSRR